MIHSRRCCCRCYCCSTDGDGGSGCGSLAHTFVKSLTRVRIKNWPPHSAHRCVLPRPFADRPGSSSSYPLTFNASSNAVLRLDEPLIRSTERDNASPAMPVVPRYFPNELFLINYNFIVETSISSESHDDPDAGKSVHIPKAENTFGGAEMIVSYIFDTLIM